jgi:prolyl oligopeptidase PreP (S9A serine peptidase family)
VLWIESGGVYSVANIRDGGTSAPGVKTLES